MDPTAVCNDPLSSSTNKFRIDVSTNGTNWVTVKTGAFGTIDDPRAHLRFIRVASDQDVAGVRFVRFWML